MFDDNAKQDSSWGTPIRILFITMLFASGFLYYYFGPSLDELQGNTPQASARTTPLSLIVGGQKFVIPENYTQFPRARHGGVRENVALYAILPDFEPYQIGNEVVFESNEADSPIVHFQLESVRSPFSEEERIERIYMPEVKNLKGERALYGLTHFQFLDGTGYQGQDLYIGRDSGGGRAAITCANRVQDIIPQNCRRFTYLTPGVILSYRFKRSRLRDWEKIDVGIRALAMSFLAGTNVSAEEAMQER